MLAGPAPSQQASLYFFVNRAETDRWFLRTCELCTLAYAVAGLPHATVHAGFVWLRQLLSALRQFSAAAAAEAADAKAGAQRAKAAAEKKAAAQRVREDNSRQKSKQPESGSAEPPAPPPKVYKILRAEGPPKVSLPRTVSKQPRASSASAAAAVSAAGAGAKHCTSAAAAPKEAVSPLKMPRRLITSMTQLAQVLTTALLELRESAELVRLHRGCVAALIPVLAHLMASKRKTDSDQAAQKASAGANNAGSAPAPDADVAEGRSFAELAASPRGAAERLLGFVLAASHRVEGRFEIAAVLFQQAAAAAAWVPAAGGEVAAFCVRQAAACYAALTDWSAIWGAGLADGTTLSEGVRERTGLRYMSAWTLPDELKQPVADAPLATQLAPQSPPMHLSAIMDGSFARADDQLRRLYPRPVDIHRPAPDKQVAAISGLHASVAAATAALQRTAHDSNAQRAAELLATTHTAAALAQLLVARLPVGTAAPQPAEALAAACARADPCAHLLAASALLDTNGGAATRGLAAASALQLRLDPALEPLHVENSGAVATSALDAAQLPLHMHVFAAARTLASAHEYGVLAAPNAQRSLPSKESALQVRRLYNCFTLWPDAWCVRARSVHNRSNTINAN